MLLFNLPVMSSSLWPHRLQHATSLFLTILQICPSSCPLHWWCHPAISSSDVLFFFCPQSFPASGIFPVSQLFSSDDQNTGASTSASVFPTVFRVDFPWVWLVWSLCFPRVFQESSPAPQFKGINSLALCLLYGPALTGIHDHWESHNLDCMDICWQNNVYALQHTV